MARTNDAILYGGIAYYAVEYENEEELRKIVNEAPSKASKDYGKPFIEVFKEANYNFYKIDPNLFAPAVLIVNNVKTGKVFKAGEINAKILIRGHEPCAEGFKINHNGKVLTIFSRKGPPCFNAHCAYLDLELLGKFENVEQLIPYIHKF